MPGRPKKNPYGECNKCDVPFTKTDAWTQCMSCLKWLHRDCTNLSKLQFDAIVEAAQEGKKSIQYYCELCETPVSDVLSNIQKFKKMQIELENIKTEISGRFDKLESRMTKMEEKVSKGITADIKSPSFRDILKKDIQTTVSQNLNEKLSRFKQQEEKDIIEEKKNNIVLFNVPESTSDDIKTRMKHDRRMFLLTYEIEEENFNDKTVKQMHRVGKKQSEKARPMVIKFTENETKMEYLKKSGDLAIAVNGEDQRIYASHDMTKDQRAKIKKLAAEVKTRKDNGEKDVVIRNYQIVKKRNFQKAGEGTTQQKSDRGPARVRWDKLFWPTEKEETKAPSRATSPQRNNNQTKP